MTFFWAENLADAKLADTTFPLAKRGMSIERDGGRIRPPHQPGQKVADTGRGPLIFRLSIPLFNGVEGRTDLYPTVYEELIDIVTGEDKGEVDYTDPVLGLFKVKVWKLDEEHDPDARDGCLLQLELEETTDDPYGIIVPVRSPGREVIEAAAALDEELDNLGVNDAAIDRAFSSSGYPRTDVERAWAVGTTFTSLAAAFQTELSFGTAYADVVASTVDRARARLSALLSIGTLRTPAGWLAYSGALRLVEALGQQGDRAIARAVTVVSYEVQGGISVYDLATKLYGDASRADEILQRNRIARPQSIAPGTIISVAVR